MSYSRIHVAVLLVVLCSLLSVCRESQAQVINYTCEQACKNIIDPIIQEQVALSIGLGYAPCECFRKPKGKSTSLCLQCNPQNCANITDGEAGEKCKNMLSAGIMFKKADDPSTVGGAATLPAFGTPQGEKPGTQPIDWNPGNTPMGPPVPTGNNPGEGGNPTPVTPDQCKTNEPLVAKVCSPNCKYYPVGSSTATKTGQCCIKVYSSVYYAQLGAYLGRGSACLCPSDPRVCVSGQGKIVANPGNLSNGGVIARVCDPSLTSSYRECITIEKDGSTVPTVTLTQPGYEVASRSGGESVMALMEEIKNRGILTSDSVFLPAEHIYNWTDISTTNMPKVYYPKSTYAGYLPDRTDFFEHTDWRIAGPVCNTPANQCIDAPSCFRNPQQQCKLESTFKPNPISANGQGSGRYIPCSLENPISTQDPTQARDSGYSQDFVADFLFYYTNLFSASNNYHSSLSQSLLVNLSANPPIEWPFSYTLGMTPKTTNTGPEISKMLYSWIVSKSWTSDPVYANSWPRLWDQIRLTEPGRRIYSIKDMEEVLACNPEATDYPIPSVVVTVSDSYFRGHAGIVYDYNASREQVSVVTTNWLFNPSCNPSTSNANLEFDYHNCYQIKNSFGVARIVDGISLTNLQKGQTSFVIDFNDRKPFYTGPKAN